MQTKGSFGNVEIGLALQQLAHIVRNARVRCIA
jgi:hypothetical protein